MLHWRVQYVRDRRPYEATWRRKRKKRSLELTILLLAVALLILCIALPIWMTAFIACAILISLGIIWYIC